MNAVVLAVGLMLVLSLCRVHGVLALIIGAVVGAVVLLVIYGLIKKN